MWGAAAVITAVLAFAADWGVIAVYQEQKPIETENLVDLADMAAESCHGDVVSDAKGSSMSDVTVTITKITQRRVRITSDYTRLAAVELDLNGVGNTVQKAGDSSLLLLELEKSPPFLNYNPDGEVAFVGQKQ